MTNKLFLLKLLNGTTVYAVAENPSDAYGKVKQGIRSYIVKEVFL